MEENEPPNRKEGRDEKWGKKRSVYETRMRSTAEHSASDEHILSLFMLLYLIDDIGKHWEHRKPASQQHSEPQQRVCGWEKYMCTQWKLLISACELQSEKYSRLFCRRPCAGSLAFADNTTVSHTKPAQRDFEFMRNIYERRIIYTARAKCVWRTEKLLAVFSRWISALMILWQPARHTVEWWAKATVPEKRQPKRSRTSGAEWKLFFAAHFASFLGTFPLPFSDWAEVYFYGNGNLQWIYLRISIREGDDLWHTTMTTNGTEKHSCRWLFCLFVFSPFVSCAA